MKVILQFLFHKTVFQIILAMVIYFSLPGIILASGDFYTSQRTIYRLDEQGQSQVSQSITLRNLKADLYATRYTLTLNGKKIIDPTAKDAKGKLPVFVETLNEGTKLTVNLRENVVGEGKEQSFEILYSLPNIASKSGQLWEIRLPSSQKSNFVDDININLIVPSLYGKLSYITPQPTKVSNEKNFINYAFHNPETNVVATFGDFQVYDLLLTYHLENPTDQKQFMEVAIPPDTGYQRMFYEKIEPTPNNVTLDADGNWLATFGINPNQKLDIEVSSYVYLFASPQQFPVYQSQDLSSYLSSSKYWQTDSEEITSLAKSHKTPKEIFDFVSNTLEYDYDKVASPSPRMGALEALKFPGKAVCLEFTDLFVSIARAASIPSRELNGFGYTDNPKLRPISSQSDVLHAWPEYFDAQSNGWIQVDPTWTNTTKGQNYFDKLDHNHITFVIHGLDPEWPRSAGIYKTEIDQKDVNVMLGKVRAPVEESISVDFNLPIQLLPFIPLKGSIEIKNKSPMAIYNLDIGLESTQINIMDNSTNISVLPPNGYQIIDANFSLKDLFTLKAPRIDLKFKNQTFDYEMPKLYFFLSQTLVPSFVALVVLSSLFVIRKIRSNAKTRPLTPKL